jgi:hypothetical protein
MSVRLALPALLLSFALVGCGEDDTPPTVGPWDCGAPEPYYLELSATQHEMCVGKEQRLTATVHWSCQKATTSEGTFVSSDPYVITIEGDKAVARGPGAVELKARAEGQESAPFVVRVVRCP